MLFDGVIFVISNMFVEGYVFKVGICFGIFLIIGNIFGMFYGVLMLGWVCLMSDEFYVV